MALVNKQTPRKGEQEVRSTAKYFEVVSQDKVPHGRNGKHKNIITRILDDLSGLKEGNAIRIRLEDLPDTKEKIRAALARAVHLRGIDIVTSTDEDHLYIWHGKKDQARDDGGSPGRIRRNQR